MEGWNLDEQKLKAEFDRKHPDWNKKRKCIYCGDTFWSGKPHNVCLTCAVKHNLFKPAPPMISNQKYWGEVIRKKLTPRVIRLIAVPFILGAGYVTNALPLAIGVSLFVTILALTRP